MKINQLFREYIPEDIYYKLLYAFGINANYSSSFSKLDLEKRNLLEAMKPIIRDLYPYYLPCKAHIYLRTPTIQTCITILRQISKLHGKILTSSQKYMNNKKVTIYTLKDNIEITKNMKMKYHPISINFS